MEQLHRNRSTAPKIYLWLVLGCILLGTVLRLSHLGDESIAFDESVIFRDLQEGTTPYLTFNEHRSSFVLRLLHWAVFHFLGPDEFLMRLPEAFEGILAIAAIYLLGGTLFNRRVGLLSAFLLTISPFHLQFSTWVRYYSLAVLLAVLTLYCIYWATQRDDWRLWLGFVLFTTLCIYNHPTGLFVLANQVAFVGILIIWRAILPKEQPWRDRVKTLALKSLALFLTVLVILGLLLMVSRLPLHLANSFSTSLFGVRLFKVPAGRLLTGFSGGSPAGRFELSLPFLASLVGDFVGGADITVWGYELVFLLGLLFMILTSRWKQFLLTGVWLAVPFALLSVADVSSVFKSRYFGFMLPLFLIVVAVGMECLGTLVARFVGSLRRRQLAWANLGLMVLLFGGLGLGPLREAATLQFPDWRGLSQFLKDRAVSGDTIMVLPYNNAPNSFLYYYRPSEENTEVIFVGWDFLEQLKARQTERPVWWVAPGSDDYDPGEWRQAGFSVYPFNGLTVLHKPGDVSTDKQLLDEAALILKQYAAKQRVGSTLLDYGYITFQSKSYAALALVRCAQNRETQCDAHFRTVIDLFVASRELWGRTFESNFKPLNRLALRLGKSGPLEAMYREWVEEWPDRPGPHRALAEWYITEGRLEEAVGEYKKLIEIGGSTPEDHGALAEAYEALGDIDQALAEYRRQVELSEGHRENQREAGTVLARAYQRQGNIWMAIQTYEETLKQVPYGTELYQNLGYLYLRTDNWSRAEDLFRRATQINSTLGWPHRALGDLHRRQGLEDQASAEFLKAIEKEPFERKAYRYLADLFEAQGDLEEAIQVYRLAARNNPRFAWPHLELGSLYVRGNRLKEAVAAYRKAVEIEPWNQTAQANLRDVHWSLASSLGNVKAYTGHTSLTWWLGEVWVRPYPYDQDVLVGRSVLGVGGLIRPDQIHLHPFGSDQDTYVRFEVEDCPYDALQIGYGLADQVAGLSDGVRYTLQASVDGGNSYSVLWDETVTDSVWLSQTLPLTAYWGEDVTFQLAVDALEDDGYDWLQTTVRLFPALGVWDLATNLDAVQVESMDAPISWSPPSIPPSGGQESSGAWVDGDGRPLVTVSQSPVQGAARGNQIQFHPFSNHQGTTITLGIADNPYATLRTAYALADEAIGQSDGVDYLIAVSADGGRTYASLLQVEVSQNVWSTEMLDLSAYLDQDLTVKIVSSSRGNENYDWLQVILDLLMISTDGLLQARKPPPPTYLVGQNTAGPANLSSLEVLR